MHVIHSWDFQFTIVNLVICLELMTSIFFWFRFESCFDSAAQQSKPFIQNRIKKKGKELIWNGHFHLIQYNNIEMRDYWNISFFTIYAIATEWGRKSSRRIKNIISKNKYKWTKKKTFWYFLYHHHKMNTLPKWLFFNICVDVLKRIYV